MTAALAAPEILAPLHDLSPDQRSEAVWFVLGWLIGANPAMAAQAVASAVADLAGHLDPELLEVQISTLLPSETVAA